MYKAKTADYKNLPFLISVFYKLTHIVLTFENFKGSDLKCQGASNKTLPESGKVLFLI